MCFGLQNKSYCIFNTQYTQNEYYKIVDQIKIEMLKRGEYNDGVDFEFSAQSYNFSTAQIFYPLKNEEIVKLGGFVAKEPNTNVGDLEIIKTNELPEVIEEVPDYILNKAIECEITKRPFKITTSELDFLRRIKIPLPTIHPMIRMENFLRLNPVGKRYKTDCAKCNKKIEALFDPMKGYLLYCEKYYQQEVY